MTENAHILLVEDDVNLGFLLTDLLEAEGFQVKWCKDGQMGLEAVEKRSFDIGILDVMMPEMDGFTLAEALREKCPELPFLFLSARMRKEDKLNGYDLGAEDYITKPFDEDVLICKLKVILRRKQQLLSEGHLPEQIHIGQYSFNYSCQLLQFEDKQWRLTEKENEILKWLCLYQNQILRREFAVEKVYGKKDYFLGRSFDVFISRLRKMLQYDPEVKIENVFKVGFILHIPERTPA